MKRVVITGLGVVSPIGNDIETFWENIKEGQTGIQSNPYFDTTEFKNKVVGAVTNFEVEDYMTRRESRRMHRFSQFAVAASIQAIDQAQYELTDENRDRVGIVLGAGIGGIDEISHATLRLDKRGPSRVSPMMVPMAVANMNVGNVSIHTGATGEGVSINTACASGTTAIGEAYLKIKHGLLDAAFAGGSEATITPVAVASFDALTALSPNPDPMLASRPFDKERDGFVAGEGAGVLFLESLDSAQARGANILAEVVGYGQSIDGYHLTAPRPDGLGAAVAMERALRSAQIEPHEIDYINAHGTSTPTNDVAETKSIKKVFGDEAYNIPVSSTKGHMGHLLGAAGGVEGIVLVKALEDGFIPMTRGLKHPDTNCDLDYVPQKGRQASLKYAMSNSLGFGGHNASIIFKRWENEA